jgi:ubiquinone/menaquinone biosynthesis C-methylase UbiE
MIVLTKNQIKGFYDRFGAKQDSQSLYEEAATLDLASHSHLETAQFVFEFGFGTGRFAEKLLMDYLPNHCRYTGVDDSVTMFGLALQRLDFWDNRVTIRLTNGSVKINEPDGKFDHFIANYVLDLMGEQDISSLIGEAHRILKPGGWLCLASLNPGDTWLKRRISAIWSFIYKLHPKSVGGCRPIEITRFIPTNSWLLEYQSIVTTFGISSEVIVAKRLP